MVKLIDGTNATMGRLASYVAKQALKGEEIAIMNCEKVIITGSKKNIGVEFYESRQKKYLDCQNELLSMQFGECCRIIERVEEKKRLRE